MQNAPNRPDIALLIIQLKLSCLRCAPFLASVCPFDLRGFAEVVGNVEIDELELQLGLSAQHDVVRLDVPMNDLIGVQERQSCQQLVSDGLDVSEGHFAFCRLVELFKCQFTSAFQNHESLIPGLVVVEHFNDVRMLRQSLQYLALVLYSRRIFLLLQ